MSVLELPYQQQHFSLEIDEACANGDQGLENIRVGSEEHQFLFYHNYFRINLYRGRGLLMDLLVT